MPLVSVAGAEVATPSIAPIMTRLVRPVRKFTMLPRERLRSVSERVTVSPGCPLTTETNCDPPATRLTVPRVSAVAD